jgi:hypothetical protein
MRPGNLKSLLPHQNPFEPSHFQNLQSAPWRWQRELVRAGTRSKRTKTKHRVSMTQAFLGIRLDLAGTLLESEVFPEELGSIGLSSMGKIQSSSPKQTQPLPGKVV